jgi:hypothetical protein
VFRLTCCLLAWTAAAWPLPAAAQAGPTCELPAQTGEPMANRSERIAQFEGLGEQCLKELSVACTDAAGRNLLDTSSAFTCSIGHEALLRRGFGGDFQAMLAWWRQRQRERTRPN